MSAPPILVVDDLHVSFDSPTGTVYAVNGVSFDLRPSEVLGILGESGCGKSATAKAIVGILSCPPARIRRGSILYKGQELTKLNSKQRRRLMGAEIAWIPQDPLSALNPVFRIGYQLMACLHVHLGMGRKAAHERAVELLTAVGLPDAEQRMRSYPHELSGGMRQRVLIAMAIAPGPSLLIADEPTTALDVTIQAEIMELLKQIQVEREMAIIHITHDCALASATVDRVAIMYAGRVVESGPAHSVFARPAHPYTSGLLRSSPALAVGSSVAPIPGNTAATSRSPRVLLLRAEVCS